MSKSVAVLLDDPRYGAGPGTVIAVVGTVADYLELITDRDGARNPRMRMWSGECAPGTRVMARQFGSDL